MIQACTVCCLVHYAARRCAVCKSALQEIELPSPARLDANTKALVIQLGPSYADIDAEYVAKLKQRFQDMMPAGVEAILIAPDITVTIVEKS